MNIKNRFFLILTTLMGWVVVYTPSASCAGMLTVINETKPIKDVQGKPYHPDDLHAVFFGETLGTPIEAKPLEARLQRVLVSDPKVTVAIPDHAQKVQIRSLFDSKNKAFASTKPITLKQGQNTTIKVTGPHMKKGRKELLIYDHGV